jgi:Ca2+-binding EF-hand superfamily protein
MTKRILLVLVLAAACGKGDKPAGDDKPAEKAGSGEDREAMRRQRLEQMRAKLDTNGDGKLSPEELGSATGRMRFDDPAALDTNHDGDISVDELEAAMKARREQWKMHGSAVTPPP